MTADRDTIIGVLLDKSPDSREVFASFGMHCTGCPASRGETIEEACEIHGISLDALLQALNQEPTNNKKG